MAEADNLFAEMFENPTVKVGGFLEFRNEIRQACHIVFGRSLSPEDFIELIAAPDGSELLIEVSFYWDLSCI